MTTWKQQNTIQTGYKDQESVNTNWAGLSVSTSWELPEGITQAILYNSPLAYNVNFKYNGTILLSNLTWNDQAKTETAWKDI